MDAQQATIERAERVAAELERSPILKEAREREATETLMKRLLACAKIRDLKQQAEAVLPGLQMTFEEAEAELKANDDRRRELVAAVQKARAALWNEKQGFEGQLSRAKGELYDSAPPELAEAQTFFRDKIDELRKKTPNVQQRTGERNLITETRNMVTFTNAPAILGAVNYCRACVSELEQMKFEAAPDMEKVETMKRAIPGTETLTEIKSDKPLPGSRGPNERLRQIGIEQEWEYWKSVLTRKADKILRKHGMGR